MEDILSELIEDSEGGLPPGFRFHPTDEELITYYLASKVFDNGISSFSGPEIHIAQLDLNRCEPWDLPEVAKMGEREWYFFSSRDRKYPTGLRTNRATRAGYWKATGKDRQVYSASTASLLGMKKTLVFYKGRAPKGEKTKWVMHEYRLDGDYSYRNTSKEELVICRIFHKIGEKKNNFIQRQQNYLIDPHFSLPPLLETLAHEQNPFMMDPNQEYPDLKTLINPSSSQSQLLKINGFTNFLSPTINNNSTSLPSKFLKSNHDFTVPRQCKTEANDFSNQSVLPPNDLNHLNDWMNKINTSQTLYPNSLFLDMGYNNFMGSSRTAEGTSVHDMSTTVDFQMISDHLKSQAQESWPLVL